MITKRIISTSLTLLFFFTAALAHGLAGDIIIFEGKSASVKAETQPKKVVKKSVKSTEKVGKKVLKKVTKKQVKKVEKAPAKTPVQDSKPPSPSPSTDTPVSTPTTVVQPKPESKTYTVAIEGFAFTPAELKIKVGDKVTFVQKDAVQHTVDTDPHPTHTELTGFDSGLLSGGQSYTFTFTKAGTFGYHCSPHPSMKGKIVVEE
jgi:amicyanin